MEWRTSRPDTIHPLLLIAHSFKKISAIPIRDVFDGPRMDRIRLFVHLN